MASPVNRKRRRKAFSRGHDRPQGMNPYHNAVLAKLWNLGKEQRLAKSGGVMPLPPVRSDGGRPAKRSPAPGRDRPNSSGRDRGSSPGRGGDRPNSSGRDRPGQHRGWR
jgi:hypothetical protein